MKILVTVGTTKFDELIEAVASSAYFADCECVLQVGPGGRHASGFRCLEYTPDIEDYYRWADVVVTHAGAGSIYRLLELSKRLVIVPNLSRVDKHQADITAYMEAHRHAIAAWSLGALAGAVQEAAIADLAPFRKTDFFAGEEIAQYIDKGDL